MNPLVGNQQGFSMLETMIAALVVAIGLVGYAQLMNTNLKNTDSAYYRNQASILVTEMFDRMRTNVTAANNGEYDIAYATATPSAVAGNRVVTDLHEWRSSVERVFPAGTSSVSCVAATSACTVSVRWDDSRATNGADDQAFTVTSLVR